MSADKLNENNCDKGLSAVMYKFHSVRVLSCLTSSNLLSADIFNVL